MKPEVHIRREVPCSATSRDLVDAACAALETTRRRPAEMTIVLTDSRRIRRLNARFGGEDAVTDVLAFPAGASVEESYLGDVVISVPRVRQQARRRAVPFSHELRLLVIHGTLHLAGMDHDRVSSRRKMWRLQAEALRRIGLDPGRLEVEP